MASEFEVHHMPVGELQCNCIIIGHKGTKEALVIDSGGDHEAILGSIQKLGWKLAKLYHTHGHIDHIGGSAALQKATGVETWVHEDDEQLWDHIELQKRIILQGFPIDIPHLNNWPKISHTFKQGDAIELAGQKIATVIHTPGHTPGSCSFYFEDMGLCITGDTLFRQGVGRTDFPGSSSQALLKSIKEKLFALPESTRCITGHGPETTIGFEKDHNYFVKF